MQIGSQIIDAAGWSCEPVAELLPPGAGLSISVWGCIGDGHLVCQHNLRVVEPEAHISDHLGQLGLLALGVGNFSCFFRHSGQALGSVPAKGMVSLQSPSAAQVHTSLHVELAYKLTLKYTETKLLKFDEI